MMAQRYPVWLHGLGTDDEPPFLPLPTAESRIEEGVLEENMVLCVEFYAGFPGKRDGVKLEDQYLITKNGARLMSDGLWHEKFQ